MRKLNEGMYIYKGVIVKVNPLTNNYEAKVDVKDYAQSIKVVGATQKDFKTIFNNIVKEYGGLREFQISVYEYEN